MELPSLWWGEKKNQPDVVVLGCETAVCGLGGGFCAVGMGLYRDMKSLRDRRVPVAVP